MATASNLKTILVVDDSALSLRTATVILGKKYEVLTAKSTGAAFSILAQAKIDLILLDIAMPGADGFAFLEEMRKFPQPEDIPVIMISSNAIGNNVIHAAKLGVRDFLKKPLDPDLLLKKVISVLREEN